MNRQETIDKYNELFISNSFNWQPFDINDLPASTRNYMQWVLDSNVKLLVHVPDIDGSYLFKLDCKQVVYILHNSNISAHIFADENFENLESNFAIASIAEEKLGLDKDKMIEVYKQIDAANSYKDN